MKNINSREDDGNKQTSVTQSAADSRFHQTLRNVQGLLKGRSFPGKILITQRLDPPDQSVLYSPKIERVPTDRYIDHTEEVDRLAEVYTLFPKKG